MTQRKPTVQPVEAAKIGEPITPPLSPDEIAEREAADKVDNPPPKVDADSIKEPVSQKPGSLFDLKAKNKSKKNKPVDPIDLEIQDALEAPLDDEYQAEYDQLQSIVKHFVEKHSQLAFSAGNRGLGNDIKVLGNALDHIVKRANGKPYWKQS